MRNNESIRTSVYKSRLLLFSSDAISSVPSLCVTSRDDGKRSALLLNEMKRRKSWKKGKWRMERKKTGGIHRISYFLAMHYTRLSFSLSPSLSPTRPILSLSLFISPSHDALFVGSCTSGTSGNEVRGEWLSAREGLGHVKKGDRGVGSSFPEISLRLV